MLGWLKNLFAKQWITLACGCKFYRGAFTPLEWVDCHSCRVRRLEEIRNHPPESRDNGGDFLCGPIPDGHTASDCGGHGGDGGCGDGGSGGE